MKLRWTFLSHGLGAADLQIYAAVVSYFSSYMIFGELGTITTKVDYIFLYEPMYGTMPLTAGGMP